MDAQVASQEKPPTSVTVDDVNRVLEVGRLLFSVLTEDEIAELQRLLIHNSKGE